MENKITKGILFDLRQTEDIGDVDEKMAKLLKHIKRSIEKSGKPFMYLTFADENDLVWTTNTALKKQRERNLGDVEKAHELGYNLHKAEEWGEETEDLIDEYIKLISNLTPQKDE